MKFKTVDSFDKDVKRLAKKFPHIKDDLTSFIDQFEKFHSFAIDIKANVFKCRIKNSDKPKGKSAGYRTYYYILQNEIVYFLTIYDKSEKESIDEDIIDELISSAH